MRTFRYNVQGDKDGVNFVMTMTEEEILRVYFPWWKAQMEKAGKANLISEESCIEDWKVVNWAWEVK